MYLDCREFDTIGFETLPYRMLIISNYFPITVYRVEGQNNYFRYITGYITGKITKYEQNYNFFNLRMTQKSRHVILAG